MKVRVVFSDGTVTDYTVETLTSDLTFISSYHKICYILSDLKQQIFKSKNILFVEQDLNLPNDINLMIKLFLNNKNNELLMVNCNIKKRIPINILEIRNWFDDITQLKIDSNDTILDIKYLLANQLNCRVEHLQLLLNYKKRILSNNMKISSLNLNNKSILHYWLEISDNNYKTFSIRSVPRLKSALDYDSQVCGEFFRKKCKLFNRLPCMGSRSFENNGKRGNYVFKSFNTINNRVTNVASGFKCLGLGSNSNTRIGICSKNRSEWLITDWANYTQGFCTVPLYSTLSKDAIEYIVNHAGVVLVVVSKESLAEVIKAKNSCKTLKYIIVMDSYPDDKIWLKNNPKEKIGYTHTFSEIERLGKINPVNDSFPDMHDIATICYTSGTTGNPKGVMITNFNIMSSIEEALEHLDDFGPLWNKDDTHFSYLPLAHVYEKVISLFMLGAGVKFGFWCGEPSQMLEDLQCLKPTFMPGVPRVYQKFKDGLLAKIDQLDEKTKKMFYYAYNARKQALANREEPSQQVEAILQKFRDAFGGRIDRISCGAAPVSVDTKNFMRCVIGKRVGEGYGLTETVAAGTRASNKDTGTYKHVGSVSTTLEMKLVDVPDMNYLTTDEPEPRGAICFRGASIFKGYYKRKDLSDKVLTKDGWFDTGDIGKWRLDGKLEIIDRKKHIFKLSQGEYIRPQYIENVYKMSKYIGHIFVYGDSFNSYLVGIIYPDIDVIKEWAKNNGLNINDWNILCKHPKVRKLIENDIKIYEKQEKLLGFEKIKDFAIWPHEFTPESGILTVTSKLKRNFAAKYFEKQIKYMYQKHSKL